MKKLMILTDDKYLSRKCALMLRNEYETVSADYGGSLDLVIREKWLDAPSKYSRCVVLREDLSLPFSPEMLKDSIDGADTLSEAAILELGERCAYLRGEPIALTEVESSLFSALIEAKGDFVSREELISRVWGEGADGGVLNVYVHYLREKLEKQGEKIIISSRKNGYKIDGKYLAKGETLDAQNS